MLPLQNLHPLIVLMQTLEKLQKHRGRVKVKSSRTGTELALALRSSLLVSPGKGLWSKTGSLMELPVCLQVFPTFWTTVRRCQTRYRRTETETRWGTPATAALRSATPHRYESRYRWLAEATPPARPGSCGSRRVILEPFLICDCFQTDIDNDLVGDLCDTNQDRCDPHTHTIIQTHLFTHVHIQTHLQAV